MDVTEVALAAVTDEYLRTIRAMEQANPEQIADFLVVAAKLLLIKSRMLLPTPPTEESEEDEGEDLARSLEVYRQYKQVAGKLAEREAAGLRAYLRLAGPPDMERRLSANGTSLAALFAALQKVLQAREPEPENVDTVVRPLRITVRQRIDDLTEQLRRGQPLRFDELVSAGASRQEVIATFLAMLELLKLGWVRVEQAGLWGRIELLPVPNALPEPQSEQGTTEIDEYV